jgi:hypothetical protein
MWPGLSARAGSPGDVLNPNGVSDCSPRVHTGSTPTGLHKSRMLCGTPLGYGALVRHTQGGGAAPLTLGFGLKPRWGLLLTIIHGLQEVAPNPTILQARVFEMIS